MTNEIVQQVEKWFSENERNISSSGLKLRINSTSATDPVRGKVEIRAETQSKIASITFWNKRDIMVLVIHKATRLQSILDDRVMAPEENVRTLLNSYLQRIEEDDNAATFSL